MEKRQSRIFNFQFSIFNGAKRPGLRAKIIIYLTIATAAALSLIGVMSMKITETAILTQRIGQAEMLATLLQSVLRTQGIRAVQGFLQAMVPRGEVHLFDKEGSVLFQYRPSDLRGPALSGDEVNRALSSRAITTRMIGKTGWLDGVGEGLVIYAPFSEGGIRIMVPLQDLKGQMANIRGFILLFVILDSIILITLGGYLLSIVVVRPIKGLEETANRIADGRLDERVVLETGDEIGGLALSFNTMAERLEEKIRTLERVNRDLLIAQEGLVRSEKLATVGRLAAGVAHEIGNPLGAILGYIGLLIKGVEDKEEEREILTRLEGETSRISLIVRDLLDFSRPSKGGVRAVDVNKVIRETVAILMPQGSFKGITINLGLKDDLPRVMIDEVRLQQVMVNILMNAADAMAPPGRVAEKREITIETEEILWDGSLGTDLKSVPMVRVAVTDTGEGIKEEDIAKVFDPFFTTKDTGKGTGLGLTVSLGIIQAYGGDIKVKSEKGLGTTFEVILPIIDTRHETQDTIKGTEERKKSFQKESYTG